MQINCGFKTAKRLRNFIDDLVDQFIEIKDRAEFLRGLLQLDQVFDLLNVQITNCGVIGDDCRGTRSHANLVVDWMTRVAARTLFSVRWNRASEVAHAGSLSLPAVRESASLRLHWSVDSKCGLSDCRAGTACRRLCFLDCEHTDIPARIQDASSSPWARFADAMAPAQRRFARHLPAPRCTRRRA